MLSELDAHCTELQRLIAKINHTNASSRLPTGETVTEALARRDVLVLRAAALRTVIRAATDRGLFGRYGRSEIRMVRQIHVSDVRSEVDARAKEQRELDNDLQEHNWTTQLIE
ncbi:MAG: DIP1984 family protein [Actinomycetota bacterium]|nr:DIP1984 family protein [Actinomycetota bacterium]